MFILKTLEISSYRPYSSARINKSSNISHQEAAVIQDQTHNLYKSRIEHYTTEPSDPQL